MTELGGSGCRRTCSTRWRLPGSSSCCTSRETRTAMRFSDVDRSVAEDYLRYVRGTHEVRLWELANWVSATGGAVEVLDGSVESLEPLYVWFKRFVDAGMPGVPDGSAPEESRLLGWSGVDRDQLRQIYGARVLSHYLFDVVRRYRPDTEWTLFIEPPGKMRWDTNLETGIVIPLRDGPSWSGILNVGRTLLSQYVDGDKLSVPDDRLRSWAVVAYLLDKQPVVPPGRSVLTEYVGAPRPDASPSEGPVPTFTPGPIRRETASSVKDDLAALLNATPPGGIDDGDWTLAAPDATGDLEEARPLPAGKVLAELNRRGYVTMDGERVTVRHLDEGITELFMPESATVDIALLVSGGKLRAVHADVVGEGGAGILAALARIPHATLHPTEDLD
ncbi:hypothetical protein [Microbacterium sp.]|uniref:hypothetical protein n=1 Tax=Microbacterium sp. TaxID=51671 RepID=UPI0039E5E2E9